MDIEADVQVRLRQLELKPQTQKPVLALTAASMPPSSTSPTATFVIGKHLPLVSTFRQTEVDYFVAFDVSFTLAVRGMATASAVQNAREGTGGRSCPPSRRESGL